VNEEAILQIIHPASAANYPVKVVDTSEQGLGLRSVEPLPPGATVHIRRREVIVAIGEVRYSVQVAGEYYSGIQVRHAADTKSSY
jgi:hypothetical protein